MIVVTPLGHATPFGGGRGGGNARAGSNGGGNGNAPLLSNTILFEQYILKDVIPTIESCDDVAANAVVAHIAASAGFAPLITGHLGNARYLEAMAHLNIQIAVVHGGGTNAGFVYHQARD